MPRYQWASLNKQQVGAYTEYFVKMEFTMYGFQVYETEVDDRGIDFIARYQQGPFFEIQVKSLRSHGYIFMEKTKFRISENSYLAIGLLNNNQMPELFLIPSLVWQNPNGVFVSRDYKDLKSKPEWGVNFSKKNMTAINEYAFDKIIEKIIR